MIQLEDLYRDASVRGVFFDYVVTAVDQLLAGDSVELSPPGLAGRTKCQPNPVHRYQELELVEVEGPTVVKLK